MNKNEIVEIVDMFELTTEASKSCVNRLESALTKTGSTASRLSMASSSLSALRDKYDDETTDYISLNALSSILKFASVLGVDNKKAQTEATPKKSRKTGWENLKDADAIPTPKIRKETKPTKRDLHEMVDQAQELMNDTEFLRVLAREIESAQAHRR
jgi:hypothetical protein